ncbi:MAG TPA: AraC family transcriptional regulator [Chitinophagaceae bacterium]|nr:AraC family transcriptional regulator [Chitinophagaceae bacterium]
MPEVYSEQTPLASQDCFVIFERRKKNFSFPIHTHPEYEINFVSNAKNAKRIIGDSEEYINEKDLVLIANPQLRHAWMDGKCISHNIHEITIQFHPSLIEPYLFKNQFRSIKTLLNKATKGICFGSRSIEKIEPLLQILSMEKEGFYAVNRLLTLLYELSKAEDIRILSSNETKEDSRNTALLNHLHDYITANISQKFLISEVAAELNMSRSTFARFLKAQLNMTYTDYLLDRRIKIAIVKLNTGLPNKDVAIQCGFNSVSYFYRVFKEVMGVNPTEFKKKNKKKRFIV